MSEYLSDDEQKQQILDWWNENGKFIVTGVVLGVIAIFAWRGWTSHLDNQAGDASVAYDALVVAVNEDKTEDIQKQFSVLSEKYQSTSYMAHADLMMAKVAVESADLDKAATSLEQAVQHSKDRELTELANFRLAKIRYAQKDYSAALSSLGKVSSKSYLPLIEELRGDVSLAQGNIEQAREAYTKAKAAMEKTPIGDPNLLEMKLSDLGK